MKEINIIKKFLFSTLEKDIARLSTKKVVDGDEMYFVDKDIFGDDEEHELNFVYGDGVAVSEDKQYIMLYTKKDNLTKAKKECMQEYDGIPAPRSYTYRDIALYEGELFRNPTI